MAVAVGIALIFMVRRSWGELQAMDLSLRDIGWQWWGLAVGCYGVTMLLSGLYWTVALRALGQQPEWGRALLAFFASQLGKYVPGKAMVVIIRTDMIRGPFVQPLPAAASVFVETLTWIAVGATIACVLIGGQFRDQTAMLGTALVLAIAAGVVTCPPVFRALTRRVLGRRPPAEVQFVNGLGWDSAAAGWGLLGIGWLLNGFSLWLVLAGIPGTDLVWNDIWVTLACVTLATVAGFVSLLPGGLGVRELVMLPLLGTRFGPGTALIAAIVIRLVWLATELAGAIMIYGLGKRHRRRAEEVSKSARI